MVSSLFLALVVRDEVGFCRFVSANRIGKEW